MQTAQKVPFTYQDYLLLPEDKRYELVNGELCMTPSPTSKHQEVVANLYDALRHFIRTRKMGKVFIAPLDVVLSEEDVVQPDLFFIPQKNHHLIQEKNVMGVPDLVVEVLSPGTAQRDRVLKRKLYHRYGVREFWIVDPVAKTIEVIGWKGSDFQTLQVYPENAILRSPLLEGFDLRISEIFED